MKSTLSQTRPGSWLRIILTAGLSLLLLVSVVAVGANAAAAHAERSVMRAQQARQSLAELLAALGAIESGQRGYLLTSQPRYLSGAGTARQRLSASLAALEASLVGQDTQLARLSQLGPLVVARFSAVGANIDMARAGDLSRARLAVQGGDGRLIMANVRTLISAMDDAERQVLTVRLRAAEEARQAAMLAVLAGIVITGALVVTTWLGAVGRMQALA